MYFTDFLHVALYNPACYGVEADGGSAYADTTVSQGEGGKRGHNRIFDYVVAELQRAYPQCAYEQHSTW